MSQQELADAMGISKPAVSKWEKGHNVPERKRIAQLAKILGIPIDRLMALTTGAADNDAASSLSDASAGDVPTLPEAVRAPDVPLPPYRSEMPKDVPVYGTGIGGSGQGNLFDFELNGTIVDYVRRPPRIAGRVDVFAAYVTGESMSPWREPGQLIYVEGAKQPKAMDYVLVELKSGDAHGVRPALVKRLVSVTSTKLKLRQFKPAKDFDVDLKTVLKVHRIMDWDELLGV